MENTIPHIKPNRKYPIIRPKRIPSIDSYLKSNPECSYYQNPETNLAQSSGVLGPGNRIVTHGVSQNSGPNTLI